MAAVVTEAVVKSGLGDFWQNFPTLDVYRGSSDIGNPLKQVSAGIDNVISLFRQSFSGGAHGGRGVIYDTWLSLCSARGRPRGVRLLMSESGDREREFFIDNLLVRIHLIVEIILVDRPCATGV